MTVKITRVLLFFSLLLTQTVSAQQRTISGVVKDADGLILPGVNIVVSGTGRGVQTDFDGMYTIRAATGDVLVFSYVGMQKQSITVGTSNQLDVMMQPGNELDEVIVVAYGNQTKKSLVGSVSSLDSENIEAQQLTSVTQALQGTVPGVNVITSGGQPGSNPTIRIRGISSINANAGPLYVVDGVPFNGNLNSISPDQIESMNVLKDASSTALYGSRGANGVILITTKRGKFNSNLQVTATAVTGFSSPAVDLHEAEGAESYLRHFWEARRNTFQYVDGQSAEQAGQNAANGIIADLGYNPYNVAQPIDAEGNIVPGAELLWDTDWKDALLNKTSLRNEYTLGIGGGSNKSKYFVSINYLNQEGAMRNSDFERISTRVNLDSKLKDWLTLGLNTAITTSKSNNPTQSGNAMGNPIGWSYNVASVFPIYRRDATGAYVLDATGAKIYDYGNNGNDLNGSRPINGNYNAVGMLFDDKHIDKNTTIIANGFIDVKFTDFLAFKTNIAYQHFLYNGYSYSNPYGGFGRDLGGRVIQNRNITTTLNVNNNLSFNKTFGDHTINANAIFETYQYKFDPLGATGTDFLANISVLNGAATPTNVSGYVGEERLTSYLGRIGYNYRDKYFIEGSFRRDGSTKFATNQRWGNFYSIGGSWIISDENFLKDSGAVNLLKLRASYGELGNNSGFGLFPYLQGYNTGVSNLENKGVLLGGITDPDLTWETTAITDIGLDFGFLDNRLQGTIGYFNKESIDLIFAKPLPGSTGNTSITTNIGSLRNYGIEFNLDADIIRADKLTWSAGINFTRVNNEVTELTQESVIRGNKRLEVGRSIFDFYIREWAGVDPEDGYGMWYQDVLDDNGEPTGERVTTKTFSDAGRYYSGSSLPDVTGGFNTSLKFGNFDFNTLFIFSYGGQIYDSNYAGLSAGYKAVGNPNGVNIAADRWQQPGDITDVPLYLTASNQFNGASTRFLFDNDYIRMRAITLGYSLPESTLNTIFINNVRFYLRGDNLFTWQSHKGIDPEQDLAGSTNFRSPQLKTISIGVNLKF
ncbi:TonB-dependent receptor [Sinomicrobium kalidii]|uniref:SusC/RagA family TonB-linked outer membrane protein n=1 Tax=Sinomicrobium kalidii TaxID=2900738 RepID=UPI001E4AC82E|nr:TonB-dependent receptor [Sinomicrobium kalidii]UGU17665.1 TonB-dependent receptor [Sinomicrobium kalidii]